MKFHRSIFFKLLAVYGLTFLLVMASLTIWGFGHSPFQRVQLVRTNLEHYASLLAEEIGLPPNLEKAETLHRDLDLDIAIDGPGLHWTTGPKAEGNSEPWTGNPVGFLGGRGKIPVVRGDLIYRFSITPTVQQGNLMAFIVVLLFLGLVLAFSWFAVRQLLRPIRDMSDVVRDFGNRNWKRRLPVHGRDELAELGSTLNSMADRIENYIDSMHNLLASVSHELRSPLTRMKVALEFLTEEKIRNSLDEEIGLLDRMTGVLLERERLRERPDALVREPVAIREWLEELAIPYRTNGLRVDLDGPELTVGFDRARFSMAVRNLWENVLRHAPGSLVKVTWEKPSGTKKLFRLVVEDNGPGLPLHVASRLGEPFLLADPSRTGQRNTGGFGLGLSLVVSIVEAHGGTLNVLPVQPHGTRIEIDVGLLEEI